MKNNNDASTRWDLDQASSTNQSGNATCHLCPQDCPGESILQNHYNIHRDEKPHAGGICDMSYARMCDRKQHQFKHGRQIKKSCNPCSKTFTRKDSYIKHMRRYHPNTIFSKPAASESKPDLCPAFVTQSLISLGTNSFDFLFNIVPLSLPAQPSWKGLLSYVNYDGVDIDSSHFDPFFLDDYLIDVTGPSTYCTICQKQVPQTQNFTAHLAEHLTDAIRPPKHTCPGCKTTFHHLFQLVAHQEALKRLASGDAKDHRCEFCKKTFGDLHVVNHTRLWIHLDLGANPQSSLCQKQRVAQDKVLRDGIVQQIKEIAEPY